MAAMDLPETSLLPGQAVQVTADEEWLKGIVASHPYLAWTEACSSLLGAAGLVEDVDLTDGTAKLQSFVRMSAGPIREIKAVQWLPLPAFTVLAEPHAAEVRADVAAPPKEERDKDSKELPRPPVSPERQADLEWSATTGHKLPLHVVIVRMDGSEFVRSVSSLNDRLEDFRRGIAAYLRKDVSQVDVVHEQTLLPKTGTFRQMSEILAPGLRLQLLLRRRKLHPGTAKRLTKELKDHEREPSNVDIEPVEDLDFDGPSNRWSASLRGPADSPYEGGVFKLEVKFPNDYPFKAPQIKFTTPVWAPDVNPQTGAIDLDILGACWSPALTVPKVMISITILLQDPGKDGCGNPLAFKQRQESIAEFEDQAREWTRKYAGDGAMAAHDDLFTNR